jgi:hypothetical protein
MFTVYASLVDFSTPAFSSIVFKIGVFVVLAISMLSLNSLYRKAFIHSKTVSTVIIVLSSVFYINEYLQIVHTIATQIVYPLFMGIWSLYLAMSVLFFKMEEHKIEDNSIFPEYDCISIDPFVEAYDFGQNPREPLEYEFERFTMFYKKAYASNGVLYLGKEQCDFFQAIDYFKEAKSEINEISSDDFKLITMFNI